MKHLIVVVAVALALGLTVSSTVFAHSAAEDGKISGLLHVDPDDIAQARRVNTFHIYFNDQDERFTMEGCDCRIKVKQNKEVILDAPLGISQIKSGTTKVFLPQDNFSYEVIASGTPKTAGFFQPFKLKFDIDVGKPPLQPQAAEDGPNLLVRGVPVVVFAGSIFGFITWRKRTRMKKKAN